MTATDRPPPPDAAQPRRRPPGPGWITAAIVAALLVWTVLLEPLARDAACDLWGESADAPMPECGPVL